MKSKQVIQYTCDHCNKKLIRKQAMITHESRCTHSPVNQRPCLECKYLEKSSAITTGDNYDGSQFEYSVNVLNCTKLQMYVYPPMSEGKQYELIDAENSPMPKECVEFKERF